VSSLKRNRAGVFACGIAACAILVAQSSDPRLDSLPAHTRAEGAAILTEVQDQKRADLARALARKANPAALTFLLRLMEHDPSPIVRKSLTDRLGRWKHPDVRSALLRAAANDGDAAVSLLAIERLHEWNGSDLRALLTSRLDKAQATGDDEGYRLLATEDDRWTALERGAMLPSFLQTAPPVFEVKPAAGRIRVVAFGDFGDGSEGQRTVARAMTRLHERAPLDLGVTLGDNFYSRGVKSLVDPYWKDRWESLYSSLSIKFYATLGNHDWGHPDSPAAEILYSSKSESWRMPATYYTFTAGPVQFFALDTSALGAAQLMWLKEELAKSRSRWKVVYGHHPIYSAGRYQDSPRMKARLLPILRRNAAIYFAGHDHDMQALRPDEGVHFFVVGGGGAGLRDLKALPHSLMAKSFHGFAVFEADDRRWEVTFYDADLNVMYRGQSHPAKDSERP
jgi:tartrate-resistant acid phosphatase type 5